MNYRADIDGLRAIAIILVLCYHGGLFFFPSGFIGVDVFFVISGFLITTIIHEALIHHHFSFVEFYNRRLWRLQPVFICCLLVTLALTLLLFLPDDLLQFSKSARKTSLFLANSYFQRTTTGYFAPEVQQLPLLHTWSLAIEWQCYLILPLLMYGLQRLCKAYLSMVIVLLTAVCWLMSRHYAQVVPAQTYYQLFSRLFEFLIGASLALMPLRAIALNKYVVNSAVVFALGIIIYIASLANLRLGYPNEYALYVCLATAFLIAMGRVYPATICTQILSTKPMVSIGLLSYSLYVWHWPILALLSYYSLTDTSFALFCAYVLIFIVAYCSWFYLEKPARRFQRLPFHYTLAGLLLFPIVLVHVVAHAITAYEGLPSRFNQELVTIYQQLNQYASHQRPQCMSGDQGVVNRQCLLGAKTKNAKTALMIGDSFSNHYWGFMDVLGHDANISILAQGISSCLTLPGIYLYDWWNYKMQAYQRCYEQTQRYYQMIRDNHYDYVIIGQFWQSYIHANIVNKLGEPYSPALTKKRFEAALEQALARITQSGAQPVFIATMASMNRNFHECFFRHIKWRQAYVAEQCDFKLSESKSERWLNQVFAKMKMKYPGFLVLDPKQIQCNKGHCRAELNGIPVYRDVGHITDYASYKFGQQYLQEFHNPLLQG